MSRNSENCFTDNNVTTFHPGRLKDQLNHFSTHKNTTSSTLKTESVCSEFKGNNINFLWFMSELIWSKIEPHASYYEVS
ncbi:CLUMA_CG002781, isoform A [Clunio marinus]|uniref:CLUMA_CG002781, isoform A n=1 Tax=Clunio marinus TaxID=568069 RepID=A0A1J1HLI2_9DIPT|nr:CLUMA_CG002781, isoform A [Clunio marinus]